jgi:adenosylcobinamide-phosphate synthase
VTAPGWLVVVGLPVVLVALAQWLLGTLTGFFVLLLHVAVLYLTVGLGAFHRQFSELQLLVGAGEEDSARVVLARWMGAGGAAVARLRGSAASRQSADVSAPTLASAAAGHAVLAAYRDVFAPLFWYLILPGAIGPVFYLFARFAACQSRPFARTAYDWIDWLPLRLLSLVFALVGRFEDTMYALRAVSPIRVSDTADPYLHQRLVLLPVAGGALGLRLADAGVDDHLRTQVPDLDLPGAEPEAASLRPVSGLLLRSGVVAAGAWLFAVLLD